MDLVIQFYFGCKFFISREAFQVKIDSGVIFLDQSQLLLRIETNESASFCIDNRLRQIAFFVFAKVDNGRPSSDDERF